MYICFQLKLSTHKLLEMSSIRELENNLELSSPDIEDGLSLSFETLGKEEPLCDSDCKERDLKAQIVKLKSENQVLRCQIRSLEEDVQSYKRLLKSLFQNYKRADELFKEKHRALIVSIKQQFDAFRDDILFKVSKELERRRGALKQVLLDTMARPE